MADVTLGDLQGYAVQPSDLADYVVNPTAPTSHYDSQKREKTKQLTGATGTFLRNTILELANQGEKIHNMLPSWMVDKETPKEVAQMQQAREETSDASIDNPIAEAAGTAVGKLIPAAVGWEAGTAFIPEVGAEAGAATKAGQYIAKNLAGATGSDVAGGDVPNLVQTPMEALIAMGTHGLLKGTGSVAKGAWRSTFSKLPDFTPASKAVEDATPEASQMFKTIDKLFQNNKMNAIPGMERAEIAGGNGETLGDYTGKYNRGTSEELGRRSNRAGNADTIADDARRDAKIKQETTEALRDENTFTQTNADNNIDMLKQLNKTYASAGGKSGSSLAAQRQAVSDYVTDATGMLKDIKDKVSDTFDNQSMKAYDARLEALRAKFDKLPQEAKDYINANYKNAFGESGEDITGDLYHRANLNRVAKRVNPSWYKGDIPLEKGLKPETPAKTPIGMAKHGLEKLSSERAANQYRQIVDEQNAAMQDVSSLARSASSAARANRPVEEAIEEAIPDATPEEVQQVKEVWENMAKTPKSKFKEAAQEEPTPEETQEIWETLNTTPKARPAAEAEEAPEVSPEEAQNVEEAVEDEDWGTMPTNSLDELRAKLSKQNEAEETQKAQDKQEQKIQDTIERNRLNKWHADKAAEEKAAKAEAARIASESEGKTLDELIADRANKADQKNAIDWGTHENVIDEIENGALGDVEPTAQAEAIRQLTKGGTKPLRSVSQVRTKLWEMEQQATRKAGTAAKQAAKAEQKAATEAAKPTLAAQEQDLIQFLNDEAPEAGKEGADLINRTIRAANKAGSKRLAPQKLQNLYKQLGDLHVKSIANRDAQAAQGEQERLNNWLKNANAESDRANAEMEQSVAERNKAAEAMKQRKELSDYIKQVEQNITDEVGSSPEAEQFKQKFLRNNVDMFDKVPGKVSQGEILRRATREAKDFASAMKDENPTTVTKALYPEIADTKASEMFNALPEDSKKTVAENLLNEMLGGRGDLKEASDVAKEFGSLTGDAKVKARGEVLSDIARNQEAYPEAPWLWMNHEMYPRLAGNAKGTITDSTGNNVRNAVFDNSEIGKKLPSRAEQTRLQRDYERMRDHGDQLSPAEKKRIKAEIRKVKELMGLEKKASGALTSRTPMKTGAWKIRK